MMTRPSSTTLDRADGGEAFRQGMRDLGYIEGRNLVVEYRAAEGKAERLSESRPLPGRDWLAAYRRVNPAFPQTCFRELVNLVGWE
jgi:hypothetical protein